VREEGSGTGNQEWGAGCGGGTVAVIRAVVRGRRGGRRAGRSARSARSARSERCAGILPASTEPWIRISERTGTPLLRTSPWPGSSSRMRLLWLTLNRARRTTSGESRPASDAAPKLDGGDLREARIGLWSCANRQLGIVGGAAAKVAFARDDYGVEVDIVCELFTSPGAASLRLRRWSCGGGSRRSVPPLRSFD